MYLFRINVFKMRPSVILDVLNYCNLDGDRFLEK